jgi:hypothetical protein
MSATALYGVPCTTYRPCTTSPLAPWPPGRPPPSPWSGATPGCAPPSDAPGPTGTPLSRPDDGGPSGESLCLVHDIKCIGVLVS